MIRPINTRLEGLGDACARSRSVFTCEADFAEFETELLDAITKLETQELDKVLQDSD